MGKPKTTSKIKLTNKSSSKKMKTNAKRIAMTKTKPSNRNFPVSTHGKKKDHSKDQTKLDYRRASAFFDDGLETDDGEFSDEGMKDFITKNMNNMSFLNTKSRRKKGENGVASFEKVPRASGLYENLESKSNTVELLPIKGEKGLIKRTGERGIYITFQVLLIILVLLYILFFVYFLTT